MKYFCPYCHTRRLHDHIRFAAEENGSNMRLVEALAAQDVDETLLNKFFQLEKLAGVSWLAFRPEKQGVTHVTLTVEDAVEAFNAAYTYIGRTITHLDGVPISKLVTDINAIPQQKRTVPILDIAEIVYLTQPVSSQAMPYAPTGLRGRPMWYGTDPTRARREEMRSFLKICGDCRRSICSAAGTMQEITIGLLGTERVGKSTCITSTLLALNSSDPNDVRVANLKGDDPKSVAFYRDLIVPYQNDFAVKKTEVKEGDFFSMSVVAELPGNGKCLLTFYDMPGELFNDSESRDGLSDLYKNDYAPLTREMDCLWFCLDLAQLTGNKDPNVMQWLGYDAADGELHIREATDLYTTIKAAREYLEQSTDSGFRWPPVAVILTKTDIAVKFSEMGNAIYDNSLLFNRDQREQAGETGIYESYAVKAPAFIMYCKDTQRLLTKIPNSNGSIQNLRNVFGSPIYFCTSAYSHGDIKKQPLADEATTVTQLETVMRDRQRPATCTPTNMLTAVNAFLKANPDMKQEYQSLQAALTDAKSDYQNLSAATPAEFAKTLFRQLCTGTPPQAFHARLPILWTLAVLGKLDVLYVHEKYKRKFFGKEVRIEKNDRARTKAMKAAQPPAVGKAMNDHLCGVEGKLTKNADNPPVYVFKEYV
ncbi:MAG: hypothetical protein LBR73_10055 [Oscillospiraceae bacterium]|jgi:hypothetical protein|nr:hypothetical protein [Oscillospiraceae bacterium]